ncbi:hypothetical protein D3C78_1577410 [compost metagenome]
MQGAGDAFAQGAAGHQRRTQRMVQRRALIVDQRAAGLALQGIQRTLRAEPDIRRPALALEHMRQVANPAHQRAELRQFAQLLFAHQSGVLEPFSGAG